MPTALFYNFSDHPFVGRWNGEDEPFAPKEKRYMPAFLAQHFAKHLVNRELHRLGLDNATSPRAPEDNADFLRLFKQAYVRDRDLPGQKKSTLRDMIDSVDLNRKSPPTAAAEDALPNKLGSDVEPKAEREVSENEDPNFTRESDGSTADASVGKPGASAPQIVTPPDFEEDDDSGYDAVPVGPQAPAPAPSSVGPDVGPAPAPQAA